MKINPGDFQEVDFADMFHKSENQSERLVHWQMTTLKLNSQRFLAKNVSFAAPESSDFLKNTQNLKKSSSWFGRFLGI